MSGNPPNPDDTPLAPSASPPTVTTTIATISTPAGDNQIHHLQTKFLRLGELYAEALENVGKDNNDAARGKAIAACVEEVRAAIGELRGVDKSEEAHEAELRKLMAEDEEASRELEEVAKEAKEALDHVRRVRRRLGEALFATDVHKTVDDTN